MPTTGFVPRDSRKIREDRENAMTSAVEDLYKVAKKRSRIHRVMDWISGGTIGFMLGVAFTLMGTIINSR